MTGENVARFAHGITRFQLLHFEHGVAARQRHFHAHDGATAMNQTRTLLEFRPGT